MGGYLAKDATAEERLSQPTYSPLLLSVKFADKRRLCRAKNPPFPPFGGVRVHYWTATPTHRKHLLFSVTPSPSKAVPVWLQVRLRVILAAAGTWRCDSVQTLAQHHFFFSSEISRLLPQVRSPG